MQPQAKPSYNVLYTIDLEEVNDDLQKKLDTLQGNELCEITHQKTWVAVVFVCYKYELV